MAPFSLLLTVAGTLLSTASSSFAAPRTSLWPRTEAAVSGSSHGNVTAGTFEWHACPKSINSTLFTCGTFQTPLDHLNITDGRLATLAFARLSARNPSTGALTPRSSVLGTLLINPGGPGTPGVSFLTTPHSSAPGGQTYAERFNDITAGRYDIASWDPRGVGASWPTSDCWSGRWDAYRISSTVADAFGSYDGERSGERQAAEILSQWELMAKLCTHANETRETMRFVGTVADARDLRLMYRALGDDKLHYWGFSWGSALGSTFADMYPAEVGRVAVDGIVNVRNYWRGSWDVNLADADATLQGFYSTCADAGSKCALTSGLQQKKLVAAVRSRVEGSLAKLGTQPAVVWNATQPGLLTWTAVKGTLLSSLYNPTTWNSLAQMLQALHEGDPAPLYALAPESVPEAEVPHDHSPQEIAAAAIACGDAIDDTAGEKFSLTPEDYDRFAQGQAQYTHNFTGAFPFTLQCHGGWPKSLKAVEQWHGNFTSVTNNPLLILSVEYDPATAHRNAVQLSNLFPHASLITRQGYGHTTSTYKSRCIEGAVGRYFVNGTMPKNGTVCPSDYEDHPLFYGNATKPKLW